MGGIRLPASLQKAALAALKRQQLVLIEGAEGVVSGVAPDICLQVTLLAKAWHDGKLEVLADGSVRLCDTVLQVAWDQKRIRCKIEEAMRSRFTTGDLIRVATIMGIDFS